MTRQLVSRDASAVIAADGTAEITIQIDGWDWVVLGVSTSTTPAASLWSQPIVSIYRGTVWVEQTLMGNGDRSDTRHLVQPGGSLTARWAGGSPGSVATFSVEALQVPAGVGVGML